MNDNLASNPEHREYRAALLRLLQKTTNPKLGLDRMAELLKLVGFDRASQKIIQVVGTNGKGSTVAFVESILKANGISTGLFTSPHLCSARERIRINGNMVSKAEFITAAHYVLDKASSLKEDASFFECMLAMALWLFKKHGVSVVILEAGLGGRLDATSAVKADMLGVSMIDLDHQPILGTTIGDIAKEKIKAAHPSQTVITVKQVSEAEAAIDDAKRAIDFSLVSAPICDKPVGLYGDHQLANAGLAIELARGLHLKLSEKKIEQGLLNVNWPGRFELIPGEVDVVLDGAHNPAGILSLITCLTRHPKFSKRPLVLVYGSLKSDNASLKVNLLINSGLHIGNIYLHQPDNPRAILISELMTLFTNNGFPHEQLFPFDDWQTVVADAKNHGAAIVVCGSLYTLGAIRGALLSIETDEKMPNF